MDEAQIRALISSELEAALLNADTFKPLGDELTRNVREYMDKVITPLEGRLEGLENTVTTPDPQPTADAKDAPLDDSPMAKRLEALEKQLADEQQARAAAQAEREALELDQHVSSVISTFSPKFANEAKQLFRSGLGDMTREGDRYLTPDGKTVEEAANAFFATPVGQHFLPSKALDGLGTDTPKEEAATATRDIPAMLLQAFS
jgi:hypothetical protein